jgi:hypothetical protein
VAVLVPAHTDKITAQSEEVYRLRRGQ